MERKATRLGWDGRAQGRVNVPTWPWLGQARCYKCLADRPLYLVPAREYLLRSRYVRVVRQAAMVVACMR